MDSLETKNYDISNAFVKLSTQDYKQLLANLNPDQAHFIHILASYVQNLHAHSIAQSQQKPHPLRYFITGGAGTGKSYTIAAITQYLLHSSPHHLPILTAPTGVAAHNISGITLHKALSLPVEHHRAGTYQPLIVDKLKDLRLQWKHIHFLIID
jgi:ATP-dependent DNA helicase PIF1